MNRGNEMSSVRKIRGINANALISKAYSIYRKGVVIHQRLATPLPIALIHLAHSIFCHRVQSYADDSKSLETMEINSTTVSFFHTCRLLGTAPYTLQRDKHNQIVDFKLNRIYCVYSIVLLIVFCATAHSSIFIEISSDPVQ